MKQKTGSVFLLIFTMAAALWLFFPARITYGSEKMILNYAISSQFLSDTNKADTKAALEIWLRKLAEKRGYTIELKVKFYDSPEELETGMVKGDINLIAMMMIDFVKFRCKSLVVPVLSYYKNNSPYDTFLLVAHRESGIKSLKDLKKRKIIVERGKKTFVPHYWLETIVMEDTHLLPKDYFGAVVMEDSPLKSTVPLYFKKADACLISRSSYNALAEMNPQYEKSFVILKESPPLALYLLCLRTTFPEKQRIDLVSVGSMLDEEVAGRQILTLFQIDKLIPFKAEYMKSCSELVKHHDSLLKAIKK